MTISFKHKLGFFALFKTEIFFFFFVPAHMVDKACLQEQISSWQEIITD